MSAMMDILRVEKMDIQPINQPASLQYSYKAGNPIISIEISAQNKWLKTSTLRVNGKIKFLKADGTTTPNNNNLVYGVPPGGNPVGTDIQMNPRVGISSVFQNVVVSSNSNNQTLESVRQYGRMCATIIGVSHSNEDYISRLGPITLGTNLLKSTKNNINNEVSFSLPLYTGMMNGGDNIPLGVNGVRGLNLQFELAADSMVMSGADAANGSYVLSEITLTADLLLPTAEGQQQMAIAGNGEFTYNSINSLYSVINASDATQTYNLAQNNVLSVFHNFLPTTYQNNYGQDSFSTDMLKTGTNYADNAQLNRVSFSRGGIRLALDYELDVAVASREGLAEVPVLLNGMNAVRAFNRINHTSNQKELIGYGGRALKIYDSYGIDDQRTGPVLQQVSTADVGVRNFVLGVGLDQISDVGMSFNGQSYSTRIQSNLDGNNPNAVYTFVKAKNTLMYSPNGISVMS